MYKKRSFFERLTGTIRMSDDFEPEDILEEEGPEEELESRMEEETEGELAVDVYDSRDSIYVKAVTAGVRKSDLDISLTREVISIAGSRQNNAMVPPEDYLYQELYWGKFSRTIVLPEEVDIEMAEAKEEHGLLTIKLPKINKSKRANLKVQ